MINLHERMLPDPAGIEPATSWSPDGRASDWATKADPNEVWNARGEGRMFQGEVSRWTDQWNRR